MTNAATGLAPVLEAVTASVEWLDAANGRSEQQVTLRVGRIAQRLGTAWEAWIEVAGRDADTDATHTRRDAADELSEMVFAALTVLQSLDRDAETVIGNAFRWLEDITPKSTPARMLQLTRAVGGVAAGRLGGEHTVSGLNHTLVEVVFAAVDAIRSLGFGPAEILTDRARAVSARIAKE